MNEKIKIDRETVAGFFTWLIEQNQNIHASDRYLLTRWSSQDRVVYSFEIVGTGGHWRGNRSFNIPLEVGALLAITWKRLDGWSDRFTGNWGAKKILATCVESHIWDDVIAELKEGKAKRANLAKAVTTVHLLRQAQEKLDAANENIAQLFGETWGTFTVDPNPEFTIKTLTTMIKNLDEVVGSTNIDPVTGKVI